MLRFAQGGLHSITDSFMKLVLPTVTLPYNLLLRSWIPGGAECDKKD